MRRRDQNREGMASKDEAWLRHVKVWPECEEAWLGHEEV